MRHLIDRISPMLQWNSKFASVVLVALALASLVAFAKGGGNVNFTWSPRLLVDERSGASPREIARGRSARLPGRRRRVSRGDVLFCTGHAVADDRRRRRRVPRRG